MSCQLAFRVTKGVTKIVRTPIFNITEKEAEEVEEPEDEECATKRCFLDMALSLNSRTHCNWLPSQDLHKTESASTLLWGKRLEKD